MARLLYGLGPDDRTATSSGATVPNAQVTVWDALTGGAQVTDITAAGVGSVSGGVVTTDAYGRVAFYGPDGGVDPLFLEGSGGGPRVRVSPSPADVAAIADLSGNASLNATIARSVETGRVAPSLNAIHPYAQPARYVLAQVGATLYAKWQIGAVPTLDVSTDNGKTWTTRSTLPAKVDQLKRVKKTGTLLIIEGETVSTPPSTPGNPRVWRSTDDGATWTLIPGVLNVPPLGSSGITEGTNGEIMISEYAALRPWTYRVRRSTDDGLTWSTAFSSDGRDPGAGDPGHMHSLTYDPVAGRHNVFLDYPIVEGSDGPQIWSSADNGATWTMLGKSTSREQPNFVTPMYFDNYVAWGSDNEINGRISRLKRADFYAGRFDLTEHVQQVSEKAIYGAFPVRATASGAAEVYLMAVNGEHIDSSLQAGRYSTMTEVYVVTNEGLTVSGGVSTYNAKVAPGALTGMRAQFPTFDSDTFERGGLAWVNFPQGGLRSTYAAIPVTQGWEPPTQQAILTAAPNIAPGAPLTVQKGGDPNTGFSFMEAQGTDGQVSIGNMGVAAGSRNTIDYKSDGTIEFRSNGTLVAKMTTGVFMGWGRLDTHSSGMGVRGGIGSPEGVVAAAIGSIYQTYSGDQLWYKYSGSATQNTGWRRLSPVALTAADLASATHAVNTTGKYEGMQAFDTTNDRPVWASGATATAPWKYADGTTAVTPA